MMAAQNIFNKAIEKSYYASGDFMCVKLISMSKTGEITQHECEEIVKLIIGDIVSICNMYSIAPGPYKSYRQLFAQIIVNTLPSTCQPCHIRDFVTPRINEQLVVMYRDWENREMLMDNFIKQMVDEIKDHLENGTFPVL